MSICKFAAEKGIYCSGFRRFSEDELRRRLDWIAKKNPNESRAELEETADRWQLARQEVDGVPTACDVQQREHDLCNGWDDFSDEELAHFLVELTGSSTPVVAQ
ncbi:MAG: hypothetical protein DMF56_01225 [Acidobacteria bacterium]|nr:MAG: hypothetical protein DMF56_01225 [Acidobacteriota bacterium]